MRDGIDKCVVIGGPGQDIGVDLGIFVPEHIVDEVANEHPLSCALRLISPLHMQHQALLGFKRWLRLRPDLMVVYGNNGSKLNTH